MNWLYFRRSINTTTSTRYTEVWWINTNESRYWANQV